MASILGRPFRASLRLCSSSRRPAFRSLTRSNSTDHHRPLMLMDLPLVASPNVFLMIKNFFSRLIINGYFDSTFAIQPFCQGARQAVTVVSHLIANDQFDDLPGFVTREVIDEVKQNYQQLSSQQKHQIPVEDHEIVFSYPYSIAITMDEPTSTRLVDISMIFHVLKDPEFYREEMMQNTAGNWLATVRKMRDNIIVCNYKFQRDMSRDAKDDSWIITGLNHWLPNEYIH